VFFLCFPLFQALKANPQGAPKDLKLSANYITKFGQVRVQGGAMTCSLPAQGCRLAWV
jgi:hypothetical protein